MAQDLNANMSDVFCVPLSSLEGGDKLRGNSSLYGILVTFLENGDVDFAAQARKHFF